MLLERYCINEETIKTIGEFSILWCRFEEVFFDRNASFSKIREWSKKLIINDELRSLYDSVKLSAIKYLTVIDEESIQERIFSKQHPGKPFEIDPILDFLNPEGSKQDWIGCMIYIQRIRNNLFHGLKSIYSLDDQRNMFIEICKLLDYILKQHHY